MYRSVFTVNAYALPGAVNATASFNATAVWRASPPRRVARIPPARNERPRRGERRASMGERARRCGSRSNADAYRYRTAVGGGGWIGYKDQTFKGPKMNGGSSSFPAVTCTYAANVPQTISNLTAPPPPTLASLLLASPPPPARAPRTRA